MPAARRDFCSFKCPWAKNRLKGLEGKMDVSNKGGNRRSEPRIKSDTYSSVEFSISSLAFILQFKIWETSASGMSILVKEDSTVLDHLTIGDVLDMKYYPAESTSNPITLKTEIKHITMDVPQRIKGHYLVGLSILEK
jgi:hypothetical protein